MNVIVPGIQLVRLDGDATEGRGGRVAIAQRTNINCCLEPKTYRSYCDRSRVVGPIVITAAFRPRQDSYYNRSAAGLANDIR